MSTDTTKADSRQRLFMPKESGAWGALLETIIAGMIAAPSWRGLSIVITLIALFFVRQPIRLVLRYLLRGRKLKQKPLVLALIVGWLLLAGTCIWLSSGVDLATLYPFAILAALGGYQLLKDVYGNGRQLIPQLAGAFGTIACVMSIIYVSTSSIVAGLIVWYILCCRHLLAILYVRLKLRTLRGQEASILPLWILMPTVFVCSTIVGAATYRFGYAMILAIILPIFRIYLSIPTLDQPIRPAKLGMQELALGLVVAILAGLSVR